MLFSAPDSVVCGPTDTPVTGCDPSKVSTSYRNQFYGNIMGVSPDGKAQPNAQDFWWDSFPGNTGNCWWENTTAAGAKLNNSPASLPDCNGGKDPSMSMGTGAPENEAELLGCFGAVSSHDYNQPTCGWFNRPGPGSPSAARSMRLDQGRWARFAAQPMVKARLCRTYRFKPASCAGL